MNGPSRFPDTSEQILISWGLQEVYAALRRTERRVLKIVIEPDRQVMVFAPIEAPNEVVAARCQRKARWVFGKLDRMSVEPTFTPSRNYLSGETHFFAGRPYRLAVKQSPEQSVHIDGDRLIICANDPDNITHCQRLLSAFYTFEARTLFPRRLSAMLPPFERRGLKHPHLLIRRMTKRWGSYTPSGNITLNIELVRAGPNLIDYVICHELAHAFHGDHGQEWRKLLTSVMPDWTDRKRLLETTLR